MTNTVNNRSRFSYNAHHTGGGGDYGTQRWSQQPQPHYSHQYLQQRHHTAPFTGSSSSLRHQETAPGTAGAAGAIPIVNGVSAAHWRQQRNVVSGNAIQPVSALVMLTKYHDNIHFVCVSNTVTGYNIQPDKFPYGRVISGNSSSVSYPFKGQRCQLVTLCHPGLSYHL